MITPGPNAIRLFVDSADRALVEPWLATGLFHGVTTNPTLLKRAGASLADIAEIYRWVMDSGAEEVCFQVWGDTADALYSSAMRIRDVAPDATIKVPVTPEGVACITRLHGQNIPILMTAVYSAQQAIIGSALGVRYMAPYFNRMRLAGRDAAAEFAAMTRAVPQDGSGPAVMAASLKSAADMVTLTDVGVRVFTISPDVVADLFGDPLTKQAVADFGADMDAVLATRR